MNVQTFPDADHDLADDPSAALVAPAEPATARPRRKAIGIVVVVALLVAGAGGLLRWSPWSSGVPAGAALVVDGHVVTISALDARMDALRALYGVVRPTDPKALDTYRRDAAKSVAMSMILDKQIAERGLQVSDKKAHDALDRFVAAQFGDGGHQAFIESLGNVGTSETQVLDEIRRQLEFQLLVDDVVGQVTISDAELATQFRQRRSELATPQTRDVRNIVVADEASAREVRRRLAAGERIGAVAATTSLDQSTRSKGGELGAVSRDQLETAVGDAVFAAREGGLYGPVKGQYGWNVGRVDSIVPGKAAEFADVRDSLRAQLVNEKGARRWWQWVTARLRAADVRYAAAYEPSDPDAAPGDASGLPASPSQGAGTE